MNLEDALPDAQGADVDLRDLLIDAGRPPVFSMASRALMDAPAPSARGPLDAHSDIEIPVHTDTHIDTHADSNPPQIPPQHADSHADLHFDNG